jgi:uncharacterized membrane protein (UPF0127 family)
MNDYIVINGNKIITKVAITEDEQETGLMGQLWPPPVMSFPFETKAVRKFWMKNTPSPLDIIFCNSGKVLEIHSGEPYSESFLGPNSPVDLVIEMPRGQADRLGIIAGSEVQLKYSVISLGKKYSNSLKVI